MNKLLMIYERDFNDDIVIVANNHKDLEDYILSLGFNCITMYSDYCTIQEKQGEHSHEAELKWIKHI